jgi:hypothetical protein
MFLLNRFCDAYLYAGKFSLPGPYFQILQLLEKEKVRISLRNDPWSVVLFLLA